MRDDQRDSAPPAGITEDLLRRLPDQRKTHRDKHSLLIAMILEVRSVNLVALAAALARPANRTNMRYQLIARFIDNHLVDCDEVMEPFVREVLARTPAMTSHGSSPCPTNPAPSQCSTIQRARDRLLLVMSLALFRGFHRPGRRQHQSHGRQKKTATSAEKPEQRRVVMVHPQRPLRRQAHRVLLADTKIMGIG